MRLKTKIGVRKARKNAELKLGFKISDEDAKKILSYCIQKLPCIKKSENYLPLLYEYTILQQLQIREINEESIARMKLRKEMEANVFNMPAVPL